MSLTEVLRAIRSLSPEAAEKLRKISFDYSGRFGFEGEYLRLNNRTVERIFAEYTSGMKPLASGQLDGVEHDLYEASDDDAADNTLDFAN
jgi:hypothetical protein